MDTWPIDRECCLGITVSIYFVGGMLLDTGLIDGEG